ncbi:MAG: T9SS type A sorting domain-containing protein [Bacteroidota bacterium]
MKESLINYMNMCLITTQNSNEILINIKKTTNFLNNRFHINFSLIVLFFIAITSSNIYAQNFWENTYANMDAQTIRETADGGFIVCSAESSTMKVYKLDYLGNVEWKRGLSGFYEGSTVKQTFDGGYIAVGRGSYLSTRCLAISKLDATGNLVWGKIQELYSVYEAKDVIQLPDSSYIICAAGGDNSGYDLSGLLRYDKNGNLLWNKSYRTCSQSGCHPLLNSLLDNGNGEFFAFGEYYTNSSAKSGWIIKFNSSGTIITQAQMGGRIYAATKTSDGNIIVTGGEGLTNDAYMMKFNSSNLAGIWRKSYSVSLPIVGASDSYGMSVIESSNSDLVLYAITNENMTRCVIIKTNSTGTAIQYYGLANFTTGSIFSWGTRMTKTSDNGYILGYRDRIKKIPEDLSASCDLLSISVTTNNLSTPSPSSVSPTLYTNNSVLGTVTSSLLTPPSTIQACSTFVCSPSTGIDVQSACNSYLWIDGNTYTSNNNTATYTFTGGAANGCDSIVTLNLTINNPTNGTDVITACDSYLWIDGNTYTASNTTATYTIPNGEANGCDSIVALNLTINNLDITTINTNDSIIANAIGAIYQWLDCDNGYAIIPGATNQLFVATANGNFAVEITQNTCTDTSACVTIIGVGICENSIDNSLHIYPNPNDGFFTLEITNFENKTIDLFLVNNMGVEIENWILNENKVEINLSNYAKGIYFLQLETKNGRITKKLLIQ